MNMYTCIYSIHTYIFEIEGRNNNYADDSSLIAGNASFESSSDKSKGQCEKHGAKIKYKRDQTNANR